MRGFALHTIRRPIRSLPQTIRRHLYIRLPADLNSAILAVSARYGIVGPDGKPRWAETARLLMLAAFTASAPMRMRLQIALRIALVIMASYVGRGLAHEFRTIDKPPKLARGHSMGSHHVNLTFDDWMYAQFEYFIRGNLATFRGANGDILDAVAAVYLMRAGLADPDLDEFARGYARETATLRHELTEAHHKMRAALMAAVGRWATQFGEEAEPMAEAVEEAAWTSAP